MIPDLELRAACEADAEEVSSLLTSCFNTFSEFGMTGKKWLEYQKIQPGFTLQGSHVAVLGKRIVGHVQTVWRLIRISKHSAVNIGGIANVCTLPEYRRKGIATALLNEAHDLMERKDVPIAGLLTEPDGIPWRLYKKMGYDKIAAITKFVSQMDLMSRRPNGTSRTSFVKTRSYKEGDEHALLQLYDEITENLAGTVKREGDYWERRYKHVFAFNGFFYEDFDPENIIVTEGSKGLSGYCFNHLMDGVGYITELLAHEPYYENTMALVDAALDRFTSKGAHSLVLFCPKETPMMECLIRSFGGKPIESEVETYMLKVLNPQKTLEVIREETCLRECAQHERDVVLEFIVGGKSAFLSIQGDNVEVGTEGPRHGTQRTAKISTTNLGFVSLLFGVVAPSELYSKGHLFCQTDWLPLLSRLFPQRARYLFPGDFW